MIMNRQKAPMAKRRKAEKYVGLYGKICRTVRNMSLKIQDEMHMVMKARSPLLQDS